MNTTPTRFLAGARALALALVAACTLAGTPAHAALPAPTPAQQQAAAAKKAQADAQAAQDKARLADSMDALSARWRARAAAQGWRTHPPVAIASAAAGTGTAASAAATGTPADGHAPAGQPEGKLTPAGAAAPMRSEKHGTAPPSRDVKAGPTKAEPPGAAPTVVKDTPKVHNR